MAFASSWWVGAPGLARRFDFEGGRLAHAIVLGASFGRSL
jgi:hypothetical protein